MMHLLLSFTFFHFSSVQLTNDTTQLQRIVPLMMDSLEVIPLPHLSEFVIGNVPVIVEFENASLNTETHVLTIQGIVSDQQNRMELPGARIVLGSLDSIRTEMYFSPRASVMTSHRGKFSLTTKINKSDILLVVWLGYLEKAYSFKNILK